MSDDPYLVRFQIWGGQKASTKRSRLHQLLFGHIQKHSGRRYFYDGILEGWDTKKGRRVPKINFTKLDEANYVVPKSVLPKLKEVALHVDVDMTFMPYNPRTNVYVGAGRELVFWRRRK